MPRLTIFLGVSASLLTGCVDDFTRDFQVIQRAPFLSTGEETTADPATTAHDETTAAATGGGLETSATKPGDGATTDDGTTTDDGATEGGATTDASSGGEDVPPMILAVDMPSKVPSAGPVPFTATTEHATAARAKVDGVDLGALKDEGGGVFSGVVSVLGAVDNGAHVLEVIAEHGELDDHRSVPFEVSTPTPGTLAWVMAGPAGSRTRRVALTHAGDVLEVGTLEIDGVPRPVIRKRSGITGAELWTEVLDDQEGAAEDVAVAPDGRLWVAMNVRAGGQWRARIVLLDPFGLWTGVEVPTEVGQIVKGIDNDGTGGCFAVGFVATGAGDTDIVVWRMTGDHVPLLGGETWGYLPEGDDKPEWYTDLPSDVVVRDGVAWILATSSGPHDNEMPRSHGLILRMDVDTAEVLGPVIVAPPSGGYTQSMFLGGASHPDGVLVTGMACDDPCKVQRVESALYTAAGARPWFRPEMPSTVAYGSALAVDAFGRVLIAATLHEGTALRGYILARDLGDDKAEPFSIAFPGSKEPSEALGVAVDLFRRIYGGGYRTVSGTPQARVFLAHP